MKATLKIQTSGEHLGVLETRELTFSTKGVMHLIDVVVDTIKDFSSDRAKRRIKMELFIDKAGK